MPGYEATRNAESASAGFVHLPERWRKQHLPVKRPNAQRHYKAFIFIVADVQTSNLTSWDTYAYHNLTIVTHLLTVLQFSYTLSGCMTRNTRYFITTTHKVHCHNCLLIYNAGIHRNATMDSQYDVQQLLPVRGSTKLMQSVSYCCPILLSNATSSANFSIILQYHI
jgi:hypothetical protein